jgi:hypothetical protein
VTQRKISLMKARWELRNLRYHEKMAAELDKQLHCAGDKLRESLSPRFKTWTDESLDEAKVFCRAR